MSWKMVAAGCLVAAALPLTQQMAASSALPTCTDGTHSDGGLTVFTSVIYGAHARITSRNPPVCGTAGDSTVWSMLVAPRVSLPSGNYSYAQAGYGRFGIDDPVSGDTRGFHPFSENCARFTFEAGCLTKTKFFMATDTVPVDAYYTTSYEPDGRVHMMYGGNPLKTATVADWAAAWQAQYFGEAHHPQDNIVGLPANKTNLDNVKILNGVPGQQGTDWVTPQSFNLLPQGLPNYYKQALQNPGGNSADFQIWTDRS
jgi:hypothetical protein